MDLKEALEKIVVTPSAHKDLEERVERYHEQLFSPEGAEALDYLKSARGFEESTIRHFKLGYVADPLPIDRGMAQGRLAIPHKTLSGYRTIRFRVMGECPQGVPKYWQPAGTNTGIFGVDILGEVTPSITLAEGEADAMILWQCGIPAIGFPGAQSVKDHHAFLLEGFERTYICGDGDDAGQTFTNKLANMVPNPIPITLPDGKDINEIYIEGGRKAVVDLLGIED